MSGAIPIKRGCGTREKSGIYCECGVSENGLPLEDFILDPPVILDPALGVSPIGVTLIQEKTPEGIVYHVADWIGANNYPNVWDFLAEARNFGVSRRLPKSLDFSKLSHKSRLLCIHSRAIVRNADRYLGRRREMFGEWANEWKPEPTAPNGPDWKPPFAFGGWKCTKGLAIHEPQHSPEPCCSGIWGQDIEHGTELTQAERERFAQVDFSKGASMTEGLRQGQITAVDGASYLWDDTRLVLRVMPSFQYVGRRAPDSAEPVYQAGFFASFPISRLVVIQGEGDAPALEKANASGMKVNVVQE